MRFRVTMKDPDTLHDAIREAVSKELTESALHVQDYDERESLIEMRSEKTEKICARWFEYGELITVEIDTVAKTCFVVERAR